MKDIHRDMERDRVLMAAEGEEGGRLTLVFYQRRRQRSVWCSAAYQIWISPFTKARKSIQTDWITKRREFIDLYTGFIKKKLLALIIKNPQKIPLSPSSQVITSEIFLHFWVLLSFNGFLLRWALHRSFWAVAFLLSNPDGKRAPFLRDTLPPTPCRLWADSWELSLIHYFLWTKHSSQGIWWPDFTGWSCLPIFELRRVNSTNLDHNYWGHGGRRFPPKKVGGW